MSEAKVMWRIRYKSFGGVTRHVSCQTEEAARCLAANKVVNGVVERALIGPWEEA